MIAMTFSPFSCLCPAYPMPSPLFWPRCWSRRHGARGDRAASRPRDAAHWPQTFLVNHSPASAAQHYMECTTQKFWGPNLPGKAHDCRAAEQRGSATAIPGALDKDDKVLSDALSSV